MRRSPFFIAVPAALIAVALLPRTQALFLPSPELVRELVAESAAKPPVEPVVHRDVVYSRDWFGARRLDIYEPLASDGDAGRAAPVVVFFHGGSWVQGDKITIRVVDRFLRRMRQAGYFVVAVNYTASLLRGLAGPVENARRSLRWIAREATAYGWDADRVGLYGVSAGGHVALMAASTMERPDLSFAFAFIECAPTDLIAMREGEAFERSGVFRLFPESRLEMLSPITYVDDDLPPVLIFHGGEDRTVHMDQSVAYVEALDRAGGEADLVVYPEGGHAFLNLPDDTWYRQETRALAFFARHFRAD